MDDLTHEIFVQLGENFITPFDREDINYLAAGLDDIADYLFASAKYIYLYKSPEVKQYSELSLLIYKSCVEIQNAIKNLKEFAILKKLKNLASKLILSKTLQMMY